jgi:hypothetical protein
MPLGSLVNPLGGGAGPTTGQIAGGVLYGLNGQTITGNSSGAWAVAANGTNQSITLTPSGTGSTVVVGDSSGNGFKMTDGGTRTINLQLFAGNQAYLTSNQPLFLTTSATNGSITLTPSGTGRIICSNPIRTPGYTVATLPASPAAGDRAHVTDATATTFMSTVVGSGANTVPVFYDGANWKIA